MARIIDLGSTCCQLCDAAAPALLISPELLEVHLCGAPRNLSYAFDSQDKFPRLIEGIRRLLNTERIQICEWISLAPFAPSDLAVGFLRSCN